MMEAADHANGSAAQEKVTEQGHEHAHEHGHDGMCEHHHMQPFDLTIFVPKADFIAISKQPPQQQIPQARTGAVSLPDSLDGYVQLFLPASNLDVLRDIKQSVADSAEGFWIGAHSFQRVPLVEEEQDQQQQENQEPRFALDGKASEIFPDTANLGSIFDGEHYKDPNARRALRAVPVPYSDSEARAHILRVRDASLSFTPALHSRRVYQPPPYDPNALVIDGGLSVFPALRSTVAEDRPEVIVNGHSPEAYSNGNAEEGKSAKKTKGKGKQKPQESQSSSQLAAGPEKKAADIASFSASFLEENFDPLAIHFERQRLLPKTSLPPPAFKNLQLSAWNPAPPHLRLRGHYMYLSVATLEGENVHITVAREGFFVNKSDNHHFDPSPRTQVSKAKPQAHITHHTLFGLLAAISPQFAERTAALFVDVSQSATDLFASLAITNCPPAAPWLVSKPEVVADGARSQIAYLVTGSTDADYLPSSKDWNEELTSMRDLPKESNDERIIRDRYASRLYADFQTAAARGVMSIERGDIPPLNSLDANESDSYLAYNILFTQAQDSADTYKHLGGDEAARATASKDVWATKLLSDADVQGLNTIATAIIDYCGKRWIAQAIPPGIFNKGPEETVVNDAPQAEADSTEAASAETQKEKAQAGGLRAVYGPVNTDKPYERYIADPSFEPLAKKVAEQFHLAKHAVTDSKGRKIEMWTPADVHGLVGADGRMYAIDLFRLSPVDVTFLEEDMTKLYGSDTSTEAAKEDAYPHRITLLRPELVELFHATKTREWIEQQVKEKTSKEEEGKAEVSSARDADADESLEKPESATSEDFVKVESEPTPEVANQETDGIQESKEKEQTVINVADFNLAFNPDAFVDRADLPYQHWKDSVSHEDDATKAVREASMHLRSTAIPALLRDIIAEETLPLDSCDLSQMLHRRGINIRYLGYIAEQCKQAPSAPNGIVRAPEAEQEVIAFLSKFRASLIGDMVLRGAKHVLRSLIAGLLLVEATEAVAHFLNCFVGKPSVQDSRPVNTTGSNAAWTQLSHELLRQQIGQQVRMRFRFVLPAASIEGFATKAQLLREICLVSGIQLVLQHYDLLGGQSNDSAAPPASDSKKKAGGKHANGASSPGTSPTFSPDDILNIYPVVKKAPFKSTMAEETLERGQVHYLRGNPALGEVFVNDALTMYDQIYGPVHPEMAESYRLVGNLYHRLTGPLLRRIQLYEQIGALQREEDRERIRKETGFESEEAFEEAKFQHEFYLQQAVKLTRQAVVISERCNGLDAAETLHCYSELAIFEHSAGNVELALKLLQHTASISNAVYGDCHPEKARAASFAATMMKSARPDNALAAIPFFKSAQTLANKAYGPNSIISANSAYQVAQCYIVNSQLAQSVPYIEQAAKIYELRMGKDSDSAREAQQLLSVVRSAVDQKEKGELEKVEKLAKRLGADPARAKELISKMQTGTGVSRSSRSSFQQAASDAVSASNGTVKRSKDSTGSRGHLDVDDLVLYIEGGPKKSSEASKKGKGKKASKA